MPVEWDFKPIVSPSAQVFVAWWFQTNMLWGVSGAQLLTCDAHPPSKVSMDGSEPVSVHRGAPRQSGSVWSQKLRPIRFNMDQYGQSTSNPPLQQHTPTSEKRASITKDDITYLRSFQNISNTFSTCRIYAQSFLFEMYPRIQSSQVSLTCGRCF